MSAHTPGPWTTNVALRSDGDIVVAHAVGPQGQAIAQLQNYGVETTGANLRLIAAAPDMLAALQTIRIQFKEFLGEDRRSRQVRDRIDAAIAKATGAA